MKEKYIKFPIAVKRGCGMDVHKDTVVVTIMGEGLRTQTRSFKTFTNSLVKSLVSIKKC